MRPLRLVLGFLALAWLSACAHSPTASSSPDIWDRLLASIGTTKDAFHLDRQDIAMFEPIGQPLPIVDAYLYQPLRIPSYVKILRQLTLADAGNIRNLVEAQGSRVAMGSRRSLVGDPLEDYKKLARMPHALVNAIAALHEDAGKKLTASQRAALEKKVASLPEELQKQSAFILETSRVAIRAVRTELSKLHLKKGLQAFLEDNVLWNEKYLHVDDVPIDPELEEVVAKVDFRRMFARGYDVVDVAERVARHFKENPIPGEFAFDWDTPYGHIALHGSQNDVYEEKPYLLIVDTGGNDLYRGGASALGTVNPVSVLIDVAGDDRYIAHPALDSSTVAQWPERMKRTAHPAFGAGLFGFGVLVDEGGNDVYRAGSDSLGRGAFGIGVLHDREGSDRYDCYAGCEGSADFGVALLDDDSGADEYHCFRNCQGFGGPQGGGMLLDAGTEADTYEANNTVREIATKRGTENNVNFAQGASAGWRGDYLDGHSLPGGVGILVDGGGDNRYTAGIFAQGTGYWYGLGILSSGDGNDSYEGAYYAQGSAVHYGVGVLHDTGGNDHYRGTEYQCMGQARDFAVGFLLDEAGNDRYEAPPYSLGSGDTNGIGIFWDRKGDDTYVTTSDQELGMARGSLDKPSLRARNGTWGIFLDTGGNDTFQAPATPARAGGKWIRRMPTGVPNSVGLVGVGWDVDEPDSKDPL